MKGDFSLSSTWQSEILRRSRRFIDIAKLIGGIITVALLVVASTCNIVPFLPDCPTRWISAAAALFGVAFSLKFLPPVRDWYTPRRLYYRTAAVATIEELRQQGEITNPIEQRLKDVALRLLGPLEDRECKTNPEMLLSQACDEMAQVVKRET